MIFLKATGCQRNGANNETAEFKQFVAKYTRNGYVNDAQLNTKNSRGDQGKYKATTEAYRLMRPDGETIDEIALLIGEAYLILGRRDEVLVSYRELKNKYPYLNSDFAQVAQHRIDLDTLRTNLKTFLPNQRDNMQYQMANGYLNIGEHEIASRELEKVYID